MLLLAILVWGLLAIIVGIEANVHGRSAIGWSMLEQVSAGLNRYFPGCLDEGIWQH
jgi:hypothetical protein